MFERIVIHIDIIALGMYIFVCVFVCLFVVNFVS